MADSAATTQTIITSIIQVSSSAIPAHDQINRGGWSSPDSLLTKLFAGEPKTILLAFLVTLTLPILLHLYFYTSSARSQRQGGVGDGIPTFLLLGPIGGGKTSLVTLLQKHALSTSPASSNADSGSNPQITVNGTGSSNGHITASPTRLSQISTTIGLYLPPGTPLGSNKYRSENDYEVTTTQKQPGPRYKIIDTPGHGKLRLEQALSHITNPALALKGVIYVLDSSSLDTASTDTDSSPKEDSVAFLHDTLLDLQRRPKVLKKKAKHEDVRVLVACNKQDLFTSLPAAAIKARLETELEKVKASKGKGISAVDAREDQEVNEDDAVLGGGGEEKFSFKLLEDEFGIAVDVVGGAVKGYDNAEGIRKWEEWIGSCL